MSRLYQFSLFTLFTVMINLFKKLRGGALMAIGYMLSPRLNDFFTDPNYT